MYATMWSFQKFKCTQGVALRCYDCLHPYKYASVCICTSSFASRLPFLFCFRLKLEFTTAGTTDRTYSTFMWKEAKRKTDKIEINKNTRSAHMYIAICAYVCAYCVGKCTYFTKKKKSGVGLDLLRVSFSSSLSLFSFRLSRKVLCVCLIAFRFFFGFFAF